MKAKSCKNIVLFFTHQSDSGSKRMESISFKAWEKSIQIINQGLFMIWITRFQQSSEPKTFSKKIEADSENMIDFITKRNMKMNSNSDRVFQSDLAL